MRSVLTKPVIVAALNYAALALVDMTMRAVQPVFLSTPIHLGGLGLPPYKIGRVLSVRVLGFSLVNLDIYSAPFAGIWGPQWGFPDILFCQNQRSFRDQEGLRGWCCVFLDRVFYFPCHQFARKGCGRAGSLCMGCCWIPDCHIYLD